MNRFAVVALTTVLGALSGDERSYRDYLLFFQSQSSVLTPVALGIVADAAEALVSHPKLSACVAGHADIGEKDPNSLSDQRARATAKELVDLGVDQNRIKSSAHGAKEPLSSGRDAMGQAMNRRVVIDLGCDGKINM